MALAAVERIFPFQKPWRTLLAKDIACPRRPEVAGNQSTPAFETSKPQELEPWDVPHCAVHNSLIGSVAMVSQGHTSLSVLSVVQEDE